MPLPLVACAGQPDGGSHFKACFSLTKKTPQVGCMCVCARRARVWVCVFNYSTLRHLSCGIVYYNASTKGGVP